MSRKLIVKLWVDFAMLVLILPALGARITGSGVHEWMGILILTLFIAHNLLNFSWYKQLFRKGKKRSFKRTLNTTVNLLLMGIMLLMMITGLMQSKVIFAGMELSGSMLLRQIHSISAYWGYILMSIHIGMHWKMLFQAFFGKLKNRPFYKILLPAAGIAIALGGMWAFVERDMYSKLFLGMSFDFWDKSASLFFVCHFLILALFAQITHYVLKVISKN